MAGDDDSGPDSRDIRLESSPFSALSDQGPGSQALFLYSRFKPVVLRLSAIVSFEILFCSL